MMRTNLVLLLIMNSISICFAMNKQDIFETKVTIKDIFHVIKQKDCERLKSLVSVAPDLLKENKKGIYPLHKAAKKGSLEIVHVLIEAGVEIDQRSYWGMSALSFAAKNGNIKLVAYLTAHGSDFYQKDQFGHSPICYAIFNGHKKTVKFLLNNAPDVKKYFVDQYLYYQGRNRDTNNLLTLACIQGHKKIARWLLDVGAPVEIEDPYDVCPLQKAAHNRYYDIVKMLLERGAKVDHQSKIIGPFCEDIDEPTALVSAVYQNHYALVELLLKYGADKEKRYCGRKPLRHAKELGHTEIAELLKKHKFSYVHISMSNSNDSLFSSTSDNKLD